MIKLAIAKIIQHHKNTDTFTKSGLASDKKDKVNINVKKTIHRVEKPILLSLQLKWFSFLIWLISLIIDKWIIKEKSKISPVENGAICVLIVSNHVKNLNNIGIKATPTV